MDRGRTDRVSIPTEYRVASRKSSTHGKGVVYITRTGTPNFTPFLRVLEQRIPLGLKEEKPVPPLDNAFFFR